MPREQSWSVFIILTWALFVAVRLTLFVVDRTRGADGPSNVFRLVGWLEQLLLLTTLIFALWLESPRMYLGSLMALGFARDSSSSSGDALVYYNVIARGAVFLYWVAALLFSLPGMPLPLRWRLFWSAQWMLIVLVPGFLLGWVPLYLQVVPIGVLWWIALHDQSRESVA